MLLVEQTVLITELKERFGTWIWENIFPKKFWENLYVQEYGTFVCRLDLLI